MTTTNKTCRVCGEHRDSSETGFMCGACRIGLAKDVSRVKAPFIRLARGARAFWTEVLRAE